MKITKKAFTLIEILVWIVIFSMVIIWWFYALSAVTLWKVKIIEKSDIAKDSYYFTQKLFEDIKSWWTVDYEEYFNRSVVWTQTLSWYYQKRSWFWNFWTLWNVWSENFWNSFYFCRSENNLDMWKNWCVSSFNTYWDNSNQPQRFWQYSFLFIDFNSNKNDDKSKCGWNSDFWDENCDWNIRWDDDDENIWESVKAFSWEVFENEVKEIYLISWDNKKRTYFRYTVKKDPYNPNTICDTALTSSWCLWNLEILKLVWKDRWMLHSTWTTSTWMYDWIVDTWIIDPEFTSWEEIIAWSSKDIWFWQPIFPETINVKKAKFFIYPNKNKKLSWKSIDQNIDVNPYLRMELILTPSWKKRWQIKWKIPELNISTTINLTNFK